MDGHAWITGQRKPRTSPGGWLDLHCGFGDFARALLGGVNGWRGRLLIELDGASTEPDFVRYFEGETLSIVDYASLSLRRLCLSFCAFAESGELRTAYRLKGGGGLTPMPREWWITDNERLRFLTNSIDPNEPYSAAADLPCWIFVNAQDFQALRDRMLQWRKSLPPFGQVHAPEAEEFSEIEVLDGLGRPICLQGYVEGSERREVYIAPARFPMPDNQSSAPLSPLAEPREATSRRKRGRRSPYDWDAMMGELLRIADEDGVEEHFSCQAEMESWAAEWFLQRTGKQPAESTIRTKVAPYYHAREDNNRLKASK